MISKFYFTNAVLIAMSVNLFSFELPNDWFKTGTKFSSYTIGLERGAGKDGKNAATIKSIDNEIDGFGGLLQDCLPDKFIGKRIRMTGFLKTKDVSEWAGFWLRIDTKTPIKAVAFDNMQNRSVKGTTDWKKYEIILDVPDNASNIAYGCLLVGSGQIWFDNLKFEIVSPDIPTTGVAMQTKSSRSKSPRIEPVNLDFEK